MTVMRDGSTVRDPRLGRLVGHDDERSLLHFAVAERLEDARAEGVQRRGKTWKRGRQLSQIGGSCVGFSSGTERECQPVAASVTDEDCLAVYRRAQELDPWPETGPNGEEGSSILAGAKAAVERGWFDRYEWCANVEDILDVLTLPTKGRGDRYGPVIVGVAWHQGMAEADHEGYIDPTGAVQGGHAIVVRGCRLKPRRNGDALDEPAFVLANTWGASWGDDGEAYLMASALESVLGTPVEAVVPVYRRKT